MKRRPERAHSLCDLSHCPPFFEEVLSHSRHITRYEQLMLRSLTLIKATNPSIPSIWSHTRRHMPHRRAPRIFTLRRAQHLVLAYTWVAKHCANIVSPFGAQNEGIQSYVVVVRVLGGTRRVRRAEALVVRAAVSNCTDQTCQQPRWVHMRAAYHRWCRRSRG